jgi:hypothetical protein
MCPSGATCLSADDCFSELYNNNTTKRVGLVQRECHHHLLIEMKPTLVMILLENWLISV